MSERIKINHETANEPEHGREHNERIARQHETRAEHAKHEHQENITQILDKVEKSSLSKKELKEHAGPQANRTEHHPKYSAGGQLGDNTLKQTLKKVRRDLNPRERVLSRVIHNPTVEKVSEVSANTIARPSGLLAGGVASFVISLAILWICHYYGYEYNFYLGLISFPIGFLIGLLGEFATKPLRRN